MMMNEAAFAFTTGYAVFLPCSILLVGLSSNPIPPFSRTKSKEMGTTTSTLTRMTSAFPSPTPLSPSLDVGEKEQFEAELPVSYTATMPIPDIGGVVADNKPDPYSTIRHSVKLSTPLSMKNLLLLSLFADVASGCGSNAYRCVNDRGSVKDDWRVTRECMERI